MDLNGVPAPQMVAPDALQDRNNNTAKVFCGGLAPHTTSESLKAFFEQSYGPVAEAKVMMLNDKGTGQIRSRGFGFCRFVTAETIDAVIGVGVVQIRLNIDGKDVDVKRIDENKTQQPGGFQAPPVDPARAELESRKIFVGGLPDSASKEKLEEYFRGCVDPNLIEAKVMVDQTSGRNRGFGYVTFSDRAFVDKALVMKDQHQIDSKWIDVKQSISRGQPGNVGPKGMTGKGGYPYGGVQYGNQNGYGAVGYGQNGGGKGGKKGKNNFGGAYAGGNGGGFKGSPAAYAGQQQASYPAPGQGYAGTAAAYPPAAQPQYTQQYAAQAQPGYAQQYAAQPAAQPGYTQQYAAQPQAQAYAGAAATADYSAYYAQQAYQGAADPYGGVQQRAAPY